MWMYRQQLGSLMSPHSPRFPLFLGWIRCLSIAFILSYIAAIARASTTPTERNNQEPPHPLDFQHHGYRRRGRWHWQALRARILWEIGLATVSLCRLQKVRSHPLPTYIELTTIDSTASTIARRLRTSASPAKPIHPNQPQTPNYHQNRTSSPTRNVRNQPAKLLSTPPA